jgi:hypothetical protein
MKNLFEIVTKSLRKAAATKSQGFIEAAVINNSEFLNIKPGMLFKRSPFSE